MSAAASVDGLGRALEATGDLIAGIKPDQWSNSTPCSEWNVRTVVNHLVFGNRMFAGILRGEEPPPLQNLRQMQGVDQLGDDPVRAHREASAELLDAFGQPGVLERVIQVPVGRIPGAVALHIRTTETLVHGWDLARATGQPARLPEDLAEEELAFSRGASAPDVPRTGHPFGPIQTVPDGAPAIDRLVAYLGRPVAGSPAETNRA